MPVTGTTLSMPRNKSDLRIMTSFKFGQIAPCRAICEPVMVPRLSVRSLLLALIVNKLKHGIVISPNTIQTRPVDTHMQNMQVYMALQGNVVGRFNKARVSEGPIKSDLCQGRRGIQAAGRTRHSGTRCVEREPPEYRLTNSQ